MVDLAILAPVVPEIVGPLAVAQRLNSLLRQGLAVARALQWSAPGSSLSTMLEHVRDLAEQGDKPSQVPSGVPSSLPAPVPAPMPAPVPLPTSLPPLPTEQGGGGGGSSFSGGSHGHGKGGGGGDAVLGGVLMVFFLRPLAVSRRLRSSGYSRSLQPLALPG